MFWGPHYLWGQVLGCCQPLFSQGLLPLLPTHSPHSQWTNGGRGNGDRGVCFGTPLPVGASFGVLTTSVWPRLAPLAPNLLFSLPMDPVEVAGNGHQMVCFGVLTICGPIFGMPTTSREPRVPPLTPSSLPSLTID